MTAILRFLFMAIWSIPIMVVAPLFILFTGNPQFPLIIAREIYSPVLLKIAGTRIKVIGKANMPINEPVIVVSNHASHIDIPCLCYALPANLHFIGKKELKWVPFLGWYMWLAGHIFIDRSNRNKAVESMKQAAQKIKNGKTVILFPEGTRSRTGQMGKFKKGAFHLAFEAGVKIVPVYVEGTRKIWPAEKFSISPGEVVVNIGKPTDVSTFDKTDLGALMKDVQSKMEAMEDQQNS